MSEHQHASVSVDKHPVSDTISEQPAAPQSQTSLDEVEDHSVANIERIYRKLDRRIISAFWVLYFLCSAIRSNVGLAQTMNTDTGHDLASVLNISRHQISTALALFYVCYVIFDLPLKPNHDPFKPPRLDEPHRDQRGLNRQLSRRNEGSMDLLRLLLGIVTAGMWPGMTYYLTLFYPPSRIGKRIGQYFTASQVSAAVVGLVSAGFQKMDGAHGLVGFQWMFLIYGVITVALGFTLLWWLPDRPTPPGEPAPKRARMMRWVPATPPALKGADAVVHYHDLKRVYHSTAWTLRDLLAVFLDWRLYPLLVMYFGVVGVGIGVQLYANLIIKAIDPTLSDVSLSLLTAPIWIMDLIAILLITPLSDRFHRHRAIFFSIPVLLQILGLLLTSYAGTDANPWPRYGGLLIVGFGLGPTVPITMTWTTEIFQPRHGELGVAAASAVVSGLGNLGSILTTYALYSGWESDYEAPGREKYRKSNLVMIGILAASILSAALMEGMLRFVDGRYSGDDEAVDGAARREVRQRGLHGLGAGVTRWLKRGKLASA
ncbi:hypothetical protein N7447_005836 [Penicillium robsamsonii]|uniref:uncharacterized protein n=1 Tax=Penicillium robsamsonii TaxID=1792511 RepID=UPI002548D6C0|nr:uncharacterized protein N7447_005836 [Penicillium robsamsonii]KAJ5823496.1 hypothetical protein N7447_005836 [Penicillium robsamsonii]